MKKTRKPGVLAPRAEYVTRCCHLDNSAIEDLLAMTDTAKEVKYTCFTKNTNWQSIARELGYATEKGENGLRLHEDYHVSFYKSTWRGEECYFLKHSAIEYIFVRPGQ